MLRIVHAEGDPVARGRAVGRELGEAIDASLASYRDRLQAQGVGSDALGWLLEPYLAASTRALPHLVRMLDAAAKAADVDPRLLFAVNAWEEVEPLVQRREAAVRCTSFTAVAPGATLLGHAEHWYAGDAGSVALVVEHPDDGSPALASPTIAPCLPAVGLNAHRVAQGIDSLAADDDGPGVPRVLALAAGGGTVRESSLARHARLEELLAARPPQTAEDAMELLRDDGVAPADGSGSATLFAVVCEVEAGRMWVAPGDPRELPFEEVDLGGVV